MKINYDVNDLARAFDFANRIAPTTKGGAWDTAAGMVIDVDANGCTTVLATDMETFLHVVFDAEGDSELPEEPVRWRVSSLFLAPFVRKLRGTVTVQPDPKNNALLFKSGQSKLLVPLMSHDTYPEYPKPPSVPPVDGANLAALGDRVMWACDSNAKTTALGGLHVDGKHLVGTRHEGMGLLPFEIDLTTPITFKGRELLGLLKGEGDVKVSADEHKVFLWLSESDWIAASLFMDPYPKYERLRLNLHSGVVSVNKAAILDALERMSIVASMDRGDMPKVVMTLTKSRLNMKMLVKSVGDSEEFIPIKDGPSVTFTSGFSLNFLLDAIRMTEDEEFQLHFGHKEDPSKASKVAIKLTDSTGWEALIMPRRGS